MGRRVFYKEEVNGEVVTHHKFVYDNYLCVQKLDALNNNSQLNLFVWDPTEPVATRPLFMLSNPGNYKFFYTFDGNKNVSELVHFESRNGIAVHYDYAPFGAITRATNTSTITDRNFHIENPFRFSSEYHDDTLALVYYNYRHYNPIDGRWLQYDFLESKKLTSFCNNTPVNNIDLLGLENYPEIPIVMPSNNQEECPPQLFVLFGGMADSFYGNVGKYVISDVKSDYPEAQIAYYYWRFHRSSSAKISSVITTFSKKCPATQVILIGHSFGGSTAAEIVSQLGNNLCKKPILVTLDAVGAMAYPPEAEQFSYWYNVYVPKGIGDIASGVPVVTSVVGAIGGFSKCNIPDWVASMGGKWGYESNATLNKKTSNNHAYANTMYTVIKKDLLERLK